MSILDKKENKLFFYLGGFFIATALIAEFIGVKIFSLEDSLSIPKIAYSLWGQDLSFNLTAGVILWPVVFIMTDIVNEYFGKRGVKFLSYFTVFLIGFAFVAVYASIHLSPADWWVGSASQDGVPNFQKAFNKIFGQGLWIIVGSLVAFLVGQLIDVIVFQKIKQRFGENKLWLRATGSTLISQLIDSFVVLIIAFKIGADWSWALVIAVGLNNYFYKFAIAVILTPILYISHYIIDRYLGTESAQKLKTRASNNG